MTLKTKLMTAFAVLAVLSLACATLDTYLMETQAPAAASNTPLPPIPSPTPLPPAVDATMPPEGSSPPLDEPAPPPANQVQTLFVDDFSDPNSGWDHFDNNDGTTDYRDGSYLVSVKTDSIMAWANPRQNFTDAVIEVIATKTGGEDDVQFGIICRYQDEDNFYTLVISADGYAAIRKRIQGSELTYLAEWVENPAILQGNTTNLLRAECVGNRLSLYANGVLLLEALDADLPSGDVGLLAGTFSATQVEILFDNFVVTAP